MTISNQTISQCLCGNTTTLEKQQAMEKEWKAYKEQAIADHGLELKSGKELPVKLSSDSPKIWEIEFDELFGKCTLSLCDEYEALSLCDEYEALQCQECKIKEFIRKTREEAREEERKRILNSLPREFWEDEDHAVGGYISKRDLKDLLESNREQL